MTKPTRRLGRGLDSLVSNLRVDQSPIATAEALPDQHQLSTGEDSTVEATMLPVDALRPNPFQPRDHTNDSDIASLARSIRQTGLLQPIVVRPIAGRHEIIAGERRWLAAKSLGMGKIPAVIRSATDEQMLEFALVENLQREDLNAVDRAEAYRQFCTRFALKPDEVATRLGEDRSTVVNYLRILDLPESIRHLVAQRKLTMGHARCLLGITDDTEQLRLAESVVKNELSVRALEEIVRWEKTRQRASPPAMPEGQRRRPAHLTDLQRRFEEAIKSKVTIQEGKRKGAGRIVIEYYSLDDFDRIAAMLGVNPE